MASTAFVSTLDLSDLANIDTDSENGEDAGVQAFIKREQRRFKDKNLDIEQCVDLVIGMFENKIKTSRKLKRLDQRQKNFLEREFLKDPNWTRQKTKMFAKTLGMKPVKIYKWKWHRIKQQEI